MSGLKETIILRAFGIAKIPLLFITRPTVVRLTRKSCTIKIPLNYLTKNHLGSMYFGVLAIGADCTGGLIAMDAVRRSKKKVSMIFKDFKADFLRRSEADVHFTCKDGDKIYKSVAKTIRTKERVNIPIEVVATTPKLSGDKHVANFILTLSLKYQGR